MFSDMMLQIVDSEPERVPLQAVRNLLQHFSETPGDRACAFWIMYMPRTTSHSLLKTSLSAIRARPYVAAGVIAGALAASAILNRQLAKKAQRDNPPTGRFLEVDGVRIHYVERGAGRPLVFSMATAA